MARVIALFYIAMQRQGLLTIIPKLSNLSNPLLSERIENVTWAIGCLTLKRFLKIVKDIWYTTFTIKA